MKMLELSKAIEKLDKKIDTLEKKKDDLVEMLNKKKSRNCKHDYWISGRSDHGDYYKCRKCGKIAQEGRDKIW